MRCVIPMRYYNKATQGYDHHLAEGIRFWKEAEVENIQKNKETFIRVDGVKVNTGYDEREFTNVALEKIK